MEQKQVVHKLKRHTLVYLNAKSTAGFWENCSSCFPSVSSVESARKDFPNLPFIVCRERETDKYIPLGMSFPVIQDNMRTRAGGYILTDDLVTLKTVTPIEAIAALLKKKSSRSNLALELLKAARVCGVELGLYGSSALSAVTGLPYMHIGSDLDMVIYPQKNVNLNKFEMLSSLLQKQYGIHADFEIETGDGYYAKFQELQRGNNTILLKGGKKPLLEDRKKILNRVERL